MSSFCLASCCSYPPPRSNHTESHRGFARRQRDAHFLFTICFSWIRAERCPAAVNYRVQAACGCLGRCRFKHAHMHVSGEEKNSTRRFACHTDLFKHSDVSHFAGLGFRMYHRDRHTAYRVLFICALFTFPFADSNSVYHFSPLHTIGVIPPKLPLFNAVFHLTAFPFTKLLPALISDILRSAAAHDYVP